jgi:hypothetical protein
VRSWMLWNPGSRYTEAALRPSIRNETQERKRTRTVADTSPS